MLCKVQAHKGMPVLYAGCEHLCKVAFGTSANLKGWLKWLRAFKSFQSAQSLQSTSVHIMYVMCENISWWKVNCHIEASPSLFTPIVIGSPPRSSKCGSEQFWENEQGKCPEYISEKTIEKWTPGQHQNPLWGKFCTGGGQTRITIENNIGDGGEVGDWNKCGTAT